MSWQGVYILYSQKNTIQNEWEQKPQAKMMLSDSAVTEKHLMGAGRMFKIFQCAIFPEILLVDLSQDKT